MLLLKLLVKLASRRLVPELVETLLLSRLVELVETLRPSKLLSKLVETVDTLRRSWKDGDGEPKPL